MSQSSSSGDFSEPHGESSFLDSKNFLFYASFLHANIYLTFVHPLLTKSPEQRFVLVLTYPLIPADTGFGVGCPQEAVYKILVMGTPRDGSWGLAPRHIPKRVTA